MPPSVEQSFTQKAYQVLGRLKGLYFAYPQYFITGAVIVVLGLAGAGYLGAKNFIASGNPASGTASQNGLTPTNSSDDSGSQGGPTSKSGSKSSKNGSSSKSGGSVSSKNTATATNLATTPSAAPTVSLSASPATITAGQSSTLSWNSTNATSCTASGAWSDTKATSGSLSVSPSANSTYRLTCTGSGGSATASTTVTVSSGSGDPSTLHSVLGFNSLQSTSDDFNGAAGSLPSSTKWGAKTFTAPSGTVWGGWSNISEDGQGNLVIKAVKDSNGVWTSGFLTGKTGYSGARYVEARAKVPCGYGTWSAPIWEWGYPYGASPMFENDVIEQLGKEPQDYHATLHNWNGGSNPQSGKTINTGVTLCNDFHYYGAAVYSDHVDFYLDGVKMASTLASAIGLSDLTTWNQVINLSQNMGGWGGTPTVSSPVTLLVDYVRVYT